MPTTTPFPKAEDWQAPWEKDGSDFDADRARALIYQLSRKDHENREKLATRDETITTLTTERDEAQGKVRAAEEKDLTEVERLKRENERLKNDPPKKDTSASDLEVARLRVALSKGLTESQAKRLVGTTQEELEADADDYLKDVKGDNGGEESGQAPAPRRIVNGRLRSPLERDGEEDTTVYDPAALAGSSTGR